MLALQIKQAADLIRKANRIAIATHIGPDGDAIGSMVGLGYALEKYGKEVTLLNDDPVPSLLQFIPGSNQIRATLEAFTPDLLIGVDSSDGERLGRAAYQLVKSGLPTINLDHHISNDGYGTLNLIDPDWVSTTEGVLELLDVLRITLDEQLAFCLLTGLVTDTRGFRTSNVTAKTLSIASRLVEAGANLPRIAALSLDRYLLHELGLVGMGLSNLKFEDHVAYTVIRLDDNPEFLKAPGLSSMLLGIEGAYVAAVFSERTGQRVEMSLRAMPGFDVAKVASALDGGGHVAAAGATVEGNVDAITAKVVGMLKQAVRDGKAQT